MNTAWYVTKRIAHAIVWWLGICSAAATVGLPLGFVLSHWFGEFGPFLAAVIILPILIYVWVVAVRGRWTAIWAVIFLVVFGWPGCWWIGMIGLGKMIIHAVGRAGASTGSDLDEPVATAHPRGLVEYASYE